MSAIWRKQFATMRPVGLDRTHKANLSSDCSDSAHWERRRYTQRRSDSCYPRDVVGAASLPYHPEESWVAVLSARFGSVQRERQYSEGHNNTHSILATRI